MQINHHQPLRNTKMCLQYFPFYLTVLDIVPHHHHYQASKKKWNIELTLLNLLNVSLVQPSQFSVFNYSIKEMYCLESPNPIHTVIYSQKCKSVRLWIRLPFHFYIHSNPFMYIVYIVLFYSFSTFDTTFYEKHA